ncbi:hypothetical protein SDC9_203004 [bioreactor metagenome]|uniref:Uncharacterized protein n=1 Tax=bioreactor metagenome TaxID=1076179 RepID=A0A645IWT0_9ZZZZ
MRLTVGRGRPVVERKRFSALAQLNTLFKYVVILPELEHFLLA